MNNRELTYYSLLSRAEMRHIEGLADNTPQETFIALGFEKKHFHHLWIGANNEAFINTVSFITDLDKLSMTLQGQLKSYVRKNGYGFEEDKGDFYTTYLARKNWLKHTIFIFNNEYNKTKNEIFIEVVKWCKDWENEWLETFNPYSPKELKDMATDLKKPLWQSLENNEIEKKLKMNDSIDAKYIKCTSQVFISDISKLCDKCPLPSLINDGMKDQITFQAQEQKEILTTEQFNNYLDEEIKSATKEMESVFLKESRKKEHKNDKGRAIRIQHYIWNKERIKALNKFKTTKNTVTKLPLKIIALKHVYEGIQITRQNGDSIAQIYGHKSGDKLFQEYTFYASSANRKGKPTPCTKVKLQNKINRLESVIELLPLDKQSRAKDEVAILRSHFDNEFG